MPLQVSVQLQILLIIPRRNDEMIHTLRGCLTFAAALPFKLQSHLFNLFTKVLGACKTRLIKSVFFFFTKLFSPRVITPITPNVAPLAP
jgi:hypothetical protein